MGKNSQIWKPSWPTSDWRRLLVERRQSGTILPFQKREIISCPEKPRATIIRQFDQPHIGKQVIDGCQREAKLLAGLIPTSQLNISSPVQQIKNQCIPVCLLFTEALHRCVVHSSEKGAKEGNQIDHHTCTPLNLNHTAQKCRLGRLVLLMCIAWLGSAALKGFEAMQQWAGVKATETSGRRAYWAGCCIVRRLFESESLKCPFGRD